MKRPADNKLRNILRKKFLNFEVQDEGPEWEEIEQHLSYDPPSDEDSNLFYQSMAIAASLAIVMMIAFMFETTTPGDKEITNPIQIPTPNSQEQTTNISPEITIQDNETGNNAVTDNMTGNGIEDENEDIRSFGNVSISKSSGDIAHVSVSESDNVSKKALINSYAQIPLTAVTVQKKDFLTLKHISANLKPLFNYHILSPIENDVAYVKDSSHPALFSTNRLGFNGSFVFNFNLSERTLLNSGISYTYRKSSFEYSYTDFRTMKEGVNHIDNTYQTAGLTLGLKRTIKSEKLFLHHLNGGIEFQQKIESLGKADDRFLILHLGYEIEYLIGNSSSVSIQPQYSYQVSNSEFAGLNVQSYWIGLQVSFNKIFSE